MEEDGTVESVPIRRSEVVGVRRVEGGGLVGVGLDGGRGIRRQRRGRLGQEKQLLPGIEYICHLDTLTTLELSTKNVGVAF